MSSGAPVSVQGRRTTPLIVVDQVLSSATNFSASLIAVVTLSKLGIAQFAVFFALVVTNAAIFRYGVLEVRLADPSLRQRNFAKVGVLVSATLGALTTLPFVVTGLDRRMLPMVAVATFVVAAIDFRRYRAFEAGEPNRALRIDAFWLGFVLLLIPLYLQLRENSALEVAALWAAAGALALIGDAAMAGATNPDSAQERKGVCVSTKTAIRISVLFGSEALMERITLAIILALALERSGADVAAGIEIARIAVAPTAVLLQGMSVVILQRLGLSDRRSIESLLRMALTVTAIACIMILVTLIVASALPYTSLLLPAIAVMGLGVIARALGSGPRESTKSDRRASLYFGARATASVFGVVLAIQVGKSASSYAAALTSSVALFTLLMWFASVGAGRPLYPPVNASGHQSSASRAI